MESFKQVLYEVIDSMIRLEAQCELFEARFSYHLDKHYPINHEFWEYCSSDDGMARQSLGKEKTAWL